MRYLFVCFFILFIEIVAVVLLAYYTDWLDSVWLVIPMDVIFWGTVFMCVDSMHCWGDR
jgi:hypothetical protein